MADNRHERRRAQRMEIKTMTMEELGKIIDLCCFKGCQNHFDRKDGGMPKGWQNIIMYGDPELVLDIREIKDWKRDGVLCPEHAAAVQNLLYPLGLTTMPSEGTT